MVDTNLDNNVDVGASTDVGVSVDSKKYNHRWYHLNRKLHQRARIVIAQAQHKCCNCGGIIEIGEKCKLRYRHNNFFHLPGKCIKKKDIIRRDVSGKE